MSPFRLFLLLLVPLLLAGCSEPVGDDDDSSDDDDAVPDFVDATFVFAPAVPGEDVEGIEVTWGEEVVATDANGRARFTLPSRTDFAVSGAAAGIQTTWIEGNTGVRSFQFTTFVGSTDLHDQVVASIGLPPRDPARGTLVVAMDTAALQAALGAVANVSPEGDHPFVFVNGQAELGRELVFQADGFVTFPNVVAGEVEVTVTPPESNICLSFPGLSGPSDYTTYTVHPGAVTTAQFICQ